MDVKIEEVIDDYVDFGGFELKSSHYLVFRKTRILRRWKQVGRFKTKKEAKEWIKEKSLGI